MSAISVRPYRPEDREAFGRVRSFTYRGGDPVLPDETLLRPDCTGYVAEQDNQIVGAFTVVDFSMSYWHTRLRCAGVAAVAVDPEERRGGVGSEMMGQSLPLLREAGFHIATLYAFRENYYRRFGYEVVGRRYRLKVPESRLPRLDPKLQMRRIENADWAVIKPCYDQFAATYNGTNFRNDEQWWRTLGGETPMTLYAAGDPVEAYVVIRLEPGFWCEQQVKEVVWSSGQGYLAAIALLAGIGINKSHISWIEPGDSPYLASFHDRDVDAEVERPLMARVLDVEHCLKSLAPVGEGSLNLDVHDPYVEANRGVWTVDFNDGRVSVQKGQGAGLKLDIRSLTQAVMGDPSFDELVVGGRVEGTPEQLEAASSLFGACRAYCADAF